MGLRIVKLTNIKNILIIKEFACAHRKMSLILYQQKQMIVLHSVPKYC